MSFRQTHAKIRAGAFLPVARDHLGVPVGAGVRGLPLRCRSAASPARSEPAGSPRFCPSNRWPRPRPRAHPRCGRGHRAGRPAVRAAARRAGLWHASRRRRATRLPGRRWNAPSPAGGNRLQAAGAEIEPDRLPQPPVAELSEIEVGARKAPVPVSAGVAPFQHGERAACRRLRGELQPVPLDPATGIQLQACDALPAEVQIRCLYAEPSSAADSCHRAQPDPAAQPTASSR